MTDAQKMTQTIKEIATAANAPPKKRSTAAQAVLIFPVGRIENRMRKLHGGVTKTRNGVTKRRVGGLAAVRVAAVAEYLMTEVLELSGECATGNKRKRITPRHIMFTVCSDHELAAVWPRSGFRNAGVVPGIHSVLLPKKRAAAGKADAATK